VQWGPVKIGNRTWLPHAWVNPGVELGDNTVVAAGSVVTKSMPSGCLVAGVPAKVIKENVYPRVLEIDELNDLLIERLSMLDFPIDIVKGRVSIDYELTIFDIPKRIIWGNVSKESELIKNQLRRNGIRFRYTDKGGGYKPW
ncbi:hypothetical protein LCGC14_3164960, partial [marine sediment metagenome]